MSKSDTDSEVFLKESEALHNLRALEEIEKNPAISQRELASRLGVALGITNSLLKTLVRKGQIKISGKNNRSLTYHVTHAGVLAKSALAMRWTINTIDYYRQARHNVAERLNLIAGTGIETVVLYGDGELAEIAAITAPEAGLTVRGLLGSEGGPPAVSTGIETERVKMEDLKDLVFDALIVCERHEESDLFGFERLLGDGIKVLSLL